MTNDETGNFAAFDAGRHGCAGRRSGARLEGVGAGAGDLALVVAAVGAGAARGLQVPDRHLRGRQSRHQGGVRADLGRGLPAQLAAAFASGQVPNIVTHLPSFAVTNYWRRVCSSRSTTSSRRSGRRSTTPAPTTSTRSTTASLPAPASATPPPNMLWLRKDLMEKAGIDKAPTHLGRAARRVPEDAGRRHLRRAAALRPQLA